MQQFDHALRERLAGMVNDEVDASEVVGSPDYIINIDRSVGNADGVCLEDVPRLFFRKAAAFYVVGVIYRSGLSEFCGRCRL